MARRAASPNFGRKPGYFEKLKMGTAHETYNPDAEGYGSVTEWVSTFNVRMGFEEAQAHKAGSKRRWNSDWVVLGEIAGVHLDENSMWDEIKKAFRKAAMNCHPDRTHVHGLEKEQAEEMFKDASAAYRMLEDIYTVQGRLK
jgi:DnaJ domain